MKTHRLLLAVGSNLHNKFNVLIDELRHSVSCIKSVDGLSVNAVSSIYETRPFGCPGRQPKYLNIVLVCSSSLPVARLLRVLKALERAAGRRQRGLNAARPLDIDIIDYGGRVIGRPRPNQAARSTRQRANRHTRSRPQRGWLTLPHPEMHMRRFVLEPLAEVAPHWQHPVMKACVRQLLARLPRPPGLIRRY